MRFLLRVAHAGFSGLLLLLPGRVRRRIGAELLAVFDARQREALEAGGMPDLLHVWISELGGVVAMAVGGRRLSAEGRHVERRRSARDALADVRIGLRSMRRRPTHAVLAMLTCGMGIGGAAAMFSVVDGVLLRPLPYPEPERVVSIFPTLEEWRDIPNLRANWDRGRFSQPEFLEWSGRQTSFSHVAPLSVWTRHMTGRGPATQVRLGITTEDLFAITAVRAERGRLLDATDGEPNAGPAAVLSYPFWQSRLGGAADILGATLTINDVAHTVVGVLPAHFRLAGHEADVWTRLPVVADERERLNHNFLAVGRLAPGVTLERAEQETALLLGALSEAHADLTHRASIRPRLEDLTRGVRGPLLLLMGGALVLLVAACVNFAGLLLGAGLDRTSELAVRGALGAGRTRIVRLLLTESVLLALLGGALGMVLAVGITRVLVLIAPPGIPRLDEVAVDVRAVAVAFGLAVIAGLVAGAIPACALGGEDVAGRLRAVRHTTRSRHRLQAALVVGQVALATLLLVAAGLLGRTLIHLERTDPGFEPDGLLAVSVAVPYYRYLDADGSFRSNEFASMHDAVVTALAGVPGVQTVATTSLLPFSGSRANNGIEVEGYEPAPGEQLIAERAFVSGSYLDVIGARLVAGRLLRPEDDRADADKVLVVSRHLARRVWPDGSAIGRTISFWAGAFTVVGVIEDPRDYSLEADDRMRIFVPASAAGQAGGDIVLRVSGDPARLVRPVRERVAGVNADLPVTRVEPLAIMIERSLVEQRYRARLFTCFAGLALFFAASGIYGAMTRRVALRRHEIGIRMALGAPRADVLHSVLREGVALAVAGIALGFLAALPAARLVTAWLSGVSPGDPLTFTCIIALLGAVAALAALAPSLRAARVDPLEAMRTE